MFGKKVTHLIQLEKESLENQYKSALLITVSHELRTPINAVIAISEMIKSSEDISKENEERLDIISGTSTYQLCLINDLLDFAQIIAGCLKISQIPFNINNLLVECLRLIKIQLQGYDIKVELKTFNLPEIITSDPYRIKQIILNLLSNAKKFTKQGVITLEAKHSEQYLTIKCTDTGIGIPKDKMSLLFKNFGKIENSFSINPQGVGLGLTISNMLVMKLGGQKINVWSELEKGSCFSFTIKLGDSQDSALEIPDENSITNLPSTITKSMPYKIEILIVDDVYFNIIALIQILKNENFNCSYSLNGEDAIFKIKTKNYACVLMDCEMPIMDGWETTRQIFLLKANHKIDVIPIIIGCTAHSSEKIRLKCVEAGMSDVIVKPCPKEFLVLKVNYWIQKSKSFDY